MLGWGKDLSSRQGSLSQPPFPPTSYSRLPHSRVLGCRRTPAGHYRTAARCAVLREEQSLHQRGPGSQLSAFFPLEHSCLHHWNCVAQVPQTISHQGVCSSTPHPLLHLQWDFHMKGALHGEWPTVLPAQDIDTALDSQRGT